MFSKLPNRGHTQQIPARKAPAKVAKIIYDIEDGWQLLKSKKGLFKKLVVLASLSFLTQFFISYIEFRAIGADVGLVSLALYTALVVVSLLVSFTPGAIGIRETMLIIVSATIGITNEQILQVAVIDRGVTFILLFVLFLLTRSGKLKKSLTSREGIV
jgi:uncharacterized protein (TIRG00374 family)